LSISIISFFFFDRELWSYWFLKVFDLPKVLLSRLSLLEVILEELRLDLLEPLEPLPSTPFRYTFV